MDAKIGKGWLGYASEKLDAKKSACEGMNTQLSEKHFFSPTKIPFHQTQLPSEYYDSASN
jgi:hypothetical protein